MKRTLATLTLLASLPCAQAALVNHTDVNGLRTFQDTSTGLIWADLDNWLPANLGAPVSPRFNSLDDYLAGLQAAGFSWATTAQVDALLATVPLGTATNADAAIAMMITDWASQVEVVFGYADQGSAAGSTRQVTQHWLNYTANPSWVSTPPQGVDFASAASLGLWAFRAEPAPAPGGSVPLPATPALVGLALAVAGISRRSRA